MEPPKGSSYTVNIDVITANVIATAENAKCFALSFLLPPLIERIAAKRRIITASKAMFPAVVGEKLHYFVIMKKSYIFF